MFIARMKTLTKEKTEKTTTYVFGTDKELNDALYHLKRCGCPVFAAEAENENAIHGRIIGKWNMEKSPSYWPGYTISSGAYKDSEWVNFGTEEQCKKWADDTNASGQCYFDTSASASHVIGTLWQTKYYRPYND